MIEYLASMALASAIGLILGYALGSKSDVPVKRTIEQMNADEAIRSNERKASAEAAWSDDSTEVIRRQANCIINLRASLIDIRNQGIASKSGTAQSMARKAKAALK
jgi:hypothetical protein